MRSGLNLVRQIVRRPGWFLENLRMQRLRRFGGEAHELPAVRLDKDLNVARALRVLLGVSELEVDTVLSGRYQPQDPDELLKAWNASNQLLDLLWVLIRELRPVIVVETGVARGFSSATILAAMTENGIGDLHSIDLPALGLAETFAGKAVPDDLRPAWHLHMGPSRVLLPPLVAELGHIDVFLHDADHTYESQLEEFRTVWPAIRPGGVLISDDVNNSAFLDFCSESNVAPILVGQAKETLVGMTRKPPLQN